MPYNNSGVYTAPVGAINALPGQIIRSATWNTIHADITAALTAIRTTYQQDAPIAYKIANYTLVPTDSVIVFNAGVTTTLTFPSAGTYPGRWLYTKTVTNAAVVASAAVVQPLAGGAASTALLAATAGKFASLQSDGTNWVIMMAN